MNVLTPVIWHATWMITHLWQVPVDLLECILDITLHSDNCRNTSTLLRGLPVVRPLPAALPLSRINWKSGVVPSRQRLKTAFESKLRR